MKITYLHNLPLEYYPPATNFLETLASSGLEMVCVFSSRNRRGRFPYNNAAINVRRTRSPDPNGFRLWRLLQVFWWHFKTAFSVARLKPDAVIYVEPHSAIAAWIYYRLFRGKGRLFIHHHEYYESRDYQRAGMKLPRLGARLEKQYLFSKAEWISQTNEDRLRLARKDYPNIPAETWHIMPNYPPAAWGRDSASGHKEPEKSPPFRMIYVGSASFDDTYIENIVNWVASHTDAIELHVCGYNVADDIWDWLEDQHFPNVSHDRTGFRYDELPGLLRKFDVGLVLYKGNTTNFIYNVPNKVFEYLRCGLEVWYPSEMKGIDTFSAAGDLPLRRIDFSKLSEVLPANIHRVTGRRVGSEFTAERAFAPLLERLGLADPMKFQVQEMSGR